jgi:hypothetical protein
LEKNIEERRHEFERQGNAYAVVNFRVVNHLLSQLRKELRKRIVELMVSLDLLYGDPVNKVIEKIVEH